MLPPALAICNNWAAVPLPPHIADLKPTRAELIVTAKGQVGALYAVTGKNMMQLRSHTMVFLNETMPITLVPRNVAPSDFYVMFAGLNKSDIELEKQKTHLVRRQVVNLLLDCYEDGIRVSVAFEVCYTKSSPTTTFVSATRHTNKSDLTDHNENERTRIVIRTNNKTSLMSLTPTKSLTSV